MVNIHIQKTDGQWVHALAIPLEDIGRFSLHPLKWLRFATFTVVGAKGHLSDTPGGNVVDYENVSLADLDNYYFTPEGNCYGPYPDHAEMSVNSDIASPVPPCLGAGI